MEWNRMVSMFAHIGSGWLGAGGNGDGEGRVERIGFGVGMGGGGLNGGE